MSQRFIFQQDEVLERVSKGKAETRLLARADRVEVIKQFVPQESTFYLDSAQEWEGFEFIYLLEGRLSYLGSEPPTPLDPGDYIAREQIEERSWFRAEADSILLYVSSQPAFKIMQDEIQGFLELAQKIEQDEYTDGHCRRLEKMARLIGEKLGLSALQLYNLSYAALFHDLGKAKIPREILQKPGELTQNEWTVVWKHTIWGREMLETKDFLREVAQIVGQTHERVDGKGYPEGLKGDQISLEARIIAAVDTYDAMTTDRPYRKALTREEAIHQLKETAGSQLDERVVEAFNDVLRDRDPFPEQRRAWFDQERVRLQQREAFLKIAEGILAGQEIQQTLDGVVAAVTEHTVFRRAALALYDRPISPQSQEEVRIVRMACSGLTPEEEERLKAHPLPPEERQKILKDEFGISRSYYIPHDRAPWREHPGIIESRTQPSPQANWHPDDSLCVPLWIEDQILGTITVDDPVDGRVPTPQSLEPMEMFASLTAIAVSEAEQKRRLQEAVDQLSHFNRFLQALNEATGIEELLELIIRQAMALLVPKADAGVFILREEERDEFHFRAAVNRELEPLKQVTFTANDLSEVVQRAERPILISAALRQRSKVVRKVERATGSPAAESLILVPIWDRTRNLLTAFLGVDCFRAGEAFTEEDAQKLWQLVPEIELALSRMRDRERLKEASWRDPLTNVYNRRYLDELMKKEQARARRYDFPISLILIDFDNFHEVNDHYGHLEGDRVLREAAALFQQNIRSIDTVIRYGGDEFLVVMPEISRPQAEQLGSRLAHCVSEQDFGIPRRVTMRIGVSSWDPQAPKAFEELFVEADSWLYQRHGDKDTETRKKIREPV